MKVSYKEALRPRIPFEIVSLSLLLILWVPFCLILICNQLAQELELRFLAPIGAFGPNKERLFNCLSIGFLALSMFFYAVDFHRKRLWIRSLLLVALAVTYLGTIESASAAKKYSTYLTGSDPNYFIFRDGFGRMRFEEYPNLDYDQVFSKDTLRFSRVDTFIDLSRFAEERFSKLRPELESAWGAKNGTYLKPFFYLNFVSSLWSFGNRVSPEKTGCVLVNEKTNFEPIPEEKINVKTYIESAIGCCSDYAYMLHFLLSQAHFESRLVEIPGHVFNEVKLDGKWMALDANINVFYRQSWQETVSNSGKEIGVVTFPLLALNPNAKQSYRPLSGSFRQLMLGRLAMGLDAPVQYSQDLPEYFR